MSDHERTINLLGAGTSSWALLPRYRASCDRLGATPALLTQGFAEFNRMTFRRRSNFGRSGVIDVTPDPEEIHQAIGNANSDDIAELNRELWEGVMYRMVDKVLEAHHRTGLTDGVTLWVQGKNTGHGRPAETGLRSLKTRKPKQFIVVHSMLPDNADKRIRLQEAHDLSIQLKDEGIVDTTFLTDNLSPFVRRHTLDVQDEFIAAAFAGLIGAQLHFPRNPSLAEVGRSLGEYGAYVGLAFRSRNLAVSREVGWWIPLRRTFGGPKRGRGALEDVLVAAQLATKEVISESECRAIDEAVDTDKPFVLQYIVPLNRKDRQWVTFSNRIRTWLLSAFPNAIPVFVSGNGTPDPRHSGDYWLQVSALYPMPDVPAPLQRILDTPNHKRRVPARGRKNP